MFALAFTLLFNFSGAAYAQEKSENLKEEKAVDSHIRIHTSQPGYMPYRFEEQGDGSLRLKPTKSVSNSEHVTPYFTIKVFNSNNKLVKQLDVKDKQFSVNGVSQEIAQIRFEYGYLIQIINHFQNRPELIQLSNVKGVIQAYNYNSQLDTTRSNMYGFRIERDGLYEEYLNQVKISDGVYKIEHPSFYFRIFDVVNGNIQIGNENSSNSQKFTFQYDNNKKAYKIKTSDNKLVTWTSGANYNVIAYPDGGHADQYWYLERGGSNRYKIVSAHNTNRLLNIDSNNTNISAAQRHGGLLQEFDLRRN